RISGFECDVVFRAKPPSPDVFGMDPDVRLQLLTEFFDTPDPAVLATVSSEQDGLTDAVLGFGSLTMPQVNDLLVGTDYTHSSRVGLAISYSRRRMMKTSLPAVAFLIPICYHPAGRTSPAPSRCNWPKPT